MAKRGVRLLIALAVMGLVLPPWPAIGPASRSAASQTNRMSAALPRKAIQFLALAGQWIARPAAQRGFLPPGGVHVTPGLPIEEPPPAPDQDGETSEFPAEGEDLAEPLARVELALRDRSGPDDPARRERAGRRDLADRATSPGRLRSRAISTLRLPPLDAPVDLCRLTC